MADAKTPNILVICGNDMGISNLSFYSGGLFGYRTANIDRLAEEGMKFTGWSASRIEETQASGTISKEKHDRLRKTLAESLTSRKEQVMSPVRRGYVSVVGAVGGVGLLAGVALGQGYVYPTRGQSPQQQQQDQAECSGWAMQQPGANPAAVAPPPGPQGQVVRGAGRGAAVGAVGGAIGGDAGKGAAIGAATGALVGGMRRADQRRAAEQQQSQTNAAYNRAFAACLEGRGYTVK